MTETAIQPSPESTPPKRKLRWLQINLRTLLVLTLVFGFGLGWVMNERRKNARVQALVRVGCRFDSSPLVDHDNSFRSSFDWLLGPNRFGIERAFCFFDNAITDAELVHLRGLANLKSLELHHSQITGAGMVHLKDLKKLETLALHDTPVMDAGLAHLKGLTRLSHLEINNSAITDARLVQLMGLTNLNQLALANTAITDIGLAHLKGLTKLESLDLAGTRVTRSGVRELKKSLPKCRIYHSAKN